jgi:glutamate/tyrosine decarboxylase-like PLP-dependent enzyme
VILPERGVPAEQLFAELDELRRADLAWREGKAFGFVYDAGPEVEAVAKRAYAAFLSENGLDPTSFPSLARLENEVMAMARAQLAAPPDAAGAFTSGGTESILCAVKAARELARATRPGIAAPEMVLPVTAHAAFHKAAQYFGIRPVVTAVDARTLAADPDDVRRAISERTVLVVASAPSYAHGVVDPVREIAALAAARDLPCHVDACVGGWLLPFFRRLGQEVPDYDFTVPGVTSMSMDLHKYGFTPKGASVVMYRNAALRRHQIFANAGWAGYSVVNMTVQSSKSGGPIAAAWAVLRFLGADGYLALARTMRDATRAIADGATRLGLRVLGRPDLSMLALAGDDVDVFHVADEMKERGWYLQPQLARGPAPPALHLTVGPSNAPHVAAFLVDLEASIAAARALPPSASIAPDLSAGLPRRLAPVHAALNAMPAEGVEAVLVEFWGQMFH